MKIVTGLAAFAIASGAFSAQAQQPSELVEQLVECRNLESALARLDCYDQATAQLGNQSAAAAGLQEPVEPEQTQANAEQPRSADNFGREHRRETEDSHGRRSVEITEAWQNPRGLWRFRLSTGAEWHQTQSERFEYDEEQSYYIESGALNSFRLSHEGTNRSIRVRRMD